MLLERNFHNTEQIKAVQRIVECFGENFKQFAEVLSMNNFHRKLPLSSPTGSNFGKFDQRLYVFSFCNSP